LLNRSQSDRAFPKLRRRIRFTLRSSGYMSHFPRTCLRRTQVSTISLHPAATTIWSSAKPGFALAPICCPTITSRCPAPSTSHIIKGSKLGSFCSPVWSSGKDRRRLVLPELSALSTQQNSSRGSRISSKRCSNSEVPIVSCSSREIQEEILKAEAPWRIVLNSLVRSSHREGGGAQGKVYHESLGYRRKGRLSFSVRTPFLAAGTQVREPSRRRLRCLDPTAA
jgi:hypothetical protein